jgi:adenylate cyclase
MARNIEIKARLDNPTEFRQLAEAISDKAAELLRQEDTFFNIDQGRLKLRLFSPRYGQLIYYWRPDTVGPKESAYYISETSDPASLKDVLARSLGVRGVVRKKRWLYQTGGTRIHLDQVEGLGDFMELEVVLQPDQSSEDGQVIARNLLTQLNIPTQALVEGAYIDLLEGQTLGNQNL